jgi:hypothetical protein
MTLDLIYRIRSNRDLHRYLRENSYWYKLLNRNPNLINKMNDDMKKAYRLTIEDKIDDLNDKVNLIKSFMDLVK